MGLESQLKKDVDKANRDLDMLNRLYNVYFQGAEEDPPRQERKQLDALVNRIKSQIATATNAGDKFLANSFVSKFQIMAGKWDKHIKGIENGTIHRPKKRE